MTAETPPATPEPSLSFRLLQIAVWGMGLLFVVGLVGLGLAVVWRSQQAEAPQPPAAGPILDGPARTGAVTPFDPRRLPVPAGAEIVDMTLDGSVLVLRLNWSDGTPGGLLWFYDLQAHRVIGELRLP